MRKNSMIFMVAAALLVLFAAQGATQTAARTDKPLSRPAMPTMVYVADFLIDTGNVGEDSRILQRSRRMREDPGMKGDKIVNLLSSSLLTELQKRGVPARRSFPGQRLADRGWLLNGQFLEVDEGNRLRRSMIGFGSGATEMQIEVEVYDLAGGPREPLLVFGTDSRSGRGPGAIVTKNPYVAAAKFVMSKRASEKDVRKIAREIADVLVNYIESETTRTGTD